MNNQALQAQIVAQEQQRARQKAATEQFMAETAQAIYATLISNHVIGMDPALNKTINLNDARELAELSRNLAIPLGESLGIITIKPGFEIPKT
jgi:hypothetical protein